MICKFKSFLKIISKLFCLEWLSILSCPKALYRKNIIIFFWTNCSIYIYYFVFGLLKSSIIANDFRGGCNLHKSHPPLFVTILTPIHVSLFSRSHGNFCTDTAFSAKHLLSYYKSCIMLQQLKFMLIYCHIVIFLSYVSTLQNILIVPLLLHIHPPNKKQIYQLMNPF